MKKIIIIAGPNGAGKTTFAEEFLPLEAGCPEFVNADLIAAGLSPFQPDQVAFAAGRLMLGRIGDLVAAGKSFAFETTLSTRGYARHIPQWRRAGYLVKLYFLTLPDAEFAIRRVERRVRFGGHDIPVATIRRRFQRGLENLRNHYLGIVDEWSIYDASENPPLLLDSGASCLPDKLMEDPVEYRSSSTHPRPVRPLDNPDFIGAEAALKRASAKAVARDLAAGLEPIVRTPHSSWSLKTERPVSDSE
jgi:predicted ABC-type ATPase